MYFVDPKGRIVKELHVLGKTKTGHKIIRFAPVGSLRWQRLVGTGGAA